MSVSGVSLTNNTLGDYTLTPLVSLTANITPKALTFSGLTANNKIYDATTLAQLTGTAALQAAEAAGAGSSSDGKWYAGDGIGISAGFMARLQVFLTGKMPGFDPPRLVWWSASRPMAACCSAAT